MYTDELYKLSWGVAFRLDIKDLTGHLICDYFTITVVKGRNNQRNP